MVRADKVAAVKEVREGFENAAATLLTHFRGLSVAELGELRAKLRETDARMRVVKNTLSRRAANEAGLDGLDDLLSGPIGLIFCAQDPVGPAKALKAFQADHPELVIHGGYLDGELLDAGEALRLADLDSREELLTKLAGLMQGALANTARLLQAATEKQGRLMQALVDAGGVEAKGFAPTAAAPAADEGQAQAAPEVTETVDEAPAEVADDASEVTEAVDEAPAEVAEGAPEAAPAESDNEAPATSEDEA